ncbi:MAG TPA: hypothetical protein VFR59_11930 [Steroidobacteraceae bacterium]|nr:hypothetical protein [Steroidobacteraceae bacterium]
MSALGIVASPPFAAEAAVQDPVPATVRACASLHVDAERLACYDRAIAALTATPDAATPPEAAKPVSAEEMFGVTAGMNSAANPPAAPEREQQLDEISAKITEIRGVANNADRALLTLDNGQVWQVTEAWSSVVMKKGDVVRIKRGTLGSFRMIGRSNRALRVKRVL